MEEKVRSRRSDGRVPPQDVTAEKSLLGAVMLSNDVLPEVLTILRPRDFYETRHQIIFQAIIDLYDQHKPIDLLTLTSELKTKKQLKEIGGGVYLVRNGITVLDLVDARIDIRHLQALCHLEIFRQNAADHA